MGHTAVEVKFPVFVVNAGKKMVKPGPYKIPPCRFQHSNEEVIIKQKVSLFFGSCNYRLCYSASPAIVFFLNKQQ